MTNRKIIDYRVRIQVAEDSPDGVLLDFLKHERHPSFSHKEMVLWALRGYWMAIAFRQRSEMGDEVVEAQVQRIVLDAIYQLRQQIAYVQRACGSQGMTALYGVENGLGSYAGILDAAQQERTQSEYSANSAPDGKRHPINQEDWYAGEDLFNSDV
jgi:hypothetical protein